MIDIQLLLNRDVAAAVCAEGLRSKSGSLVYAATQQAARSGRLLDLLTLGDRMRLFLAISLVGLNSWEAQRISPAYSSRLRLASYTGIVTASLSVIFALNELTYFAAQPRAWRSGLFGAAIAILIAGAVVAARRRDWIMIRLLNGGVKYWRGLLGFLAFLGSIGLIVEVLSIAIRHPLSLGGVLTIAALLWPVCAIYYLAVDADAKPTIWAFPFVAVAGSAWTWAMAPRSKSISPRTGSRHRSSFWPTKRQMAGTAIFLIAIADIFSLTRSSLQDGSLIALVASSTQIFMHC